MAYSCIILAFWSWWELRSRPDCWTVHHRSGWNTWAKNRPWRRLLTYNGTQVVCCRIYKYCPSLLWQSTFGQSLFPKVEVNDLAPAPHAARAASYMSAMELWHPQKNPGVPGPVPVSSCHSCMSCKYCFPEDRLPPE